MLERSLIIRIVLFMLSCDTSIAEETTSPAVNGSLEAFSVIVPSPTGTLILFMDTKDIVVEFNFTVECSSSDEKFVLKSTVDDVDRVNLRSNDVIIDCKSRVVDTALESASNVSSMSHVYASFDKNFGGKMRYVVHGVIPLTMDAIMIGRTFITFTLQTNASASVTDTSINYKVPVSILRTMRPIDTAFRVVIYIFLVFVNLAFGAKLDLKVVKENIKRPVAPIIGLVGQFIVMPMIGFGIAKVVVKNEPSIALGIFVAACCPGGGASNMYSYLLGGDLSLSITMTALSTVLALGMMPLWLYTLGSHLMRTNTQVPFGNIVTTLLVLIIPLVVGIIMKKKLPKVTDFVVKVLKPVTVICIIILLSVGIYSNLYIFKLFEPKIILAGCLLPYIGYVMGGLLATIVRLPWGRIKTVAIETGMQNTGIAMIIMMYSFPPPDGYIAAVAPIASAVMTPLPLFVITVPYLIYRRVNKDKYANVPTEGREPEKKHRKSIELGLKIENGKAELLET